MLTLIKFIHLLNTRSQSSQEILHQQTNLQTSRLPIEAEAPPLNNHQIASGFQIIWAIIVLGLGGLGRIEPTQAKSLVSDKSSQILAQTTPATPTPNINTKIQNNLNLPTTGNEVQITGNKSLTLKQAIDIAFGNNREVQAARLIVNRSQVGISEAQAAQAVQVGLTSTLQNQGSPLIIGTQSQFGSNTSTNIQGGLQATYNILSAGRNQSSVRAAEEQVNFDRLDLIRVEQLVRSQVITAYYDLQAADSSVIINQAAVIDATRSLSDAQLQEKAGIGTKFDILRAQVQLATADRDLTNAQGQQQTARKKIAQLLSVDNNTEFKAADTVREVGAWGYSLEDSVVLAYKNRPEVKQQLVRRTIGQQQQIVAAAADSAQVDLFANYTLAKSLTTSNSAQDNYSIGAQLRWNFFDGGFARAGSNRERVNQEIFENQFTTTRNQVRFEVEQAYNSLGSNQKNIATSTQPLKQAEESLKLARLRFQAGVGTQTDVIQAQTELARARGNRITAIIDYNRALSSLRVATLTGE
ncbi:TolC family protein [Chamaesiphon minutus]|uniref:Outer membrane protein n=1 Tax=Chamaesiphon minutus (strain ATCC 27169 / PCC 6605) TaxID=1173020 RepID=K9UQ30_CHAP6|nr:TolC family protein [Chamaesiphon minutus]AFY97187.1 outer membrane protein [Chamaesiphon minutus PCC 6605]